MLWLLISRCTIPRLCIYWNTLAVSSAIFILLPMSRSIWLFFRCSKLNILYATCSKTITMLGIFGMTPISRQMFGCRKIACIIISFWISDNKSSVMDGSKIFLIATGVPFRNPLWITLNPPCPIYSPNCKSSKEISLTPGTIGSLPAVTDTSLTFEVKLWKLDL